MAKIKGREIIARLGRLQVALSEQCSLINRGGCGVMAAIVGEALTELGIVCDVATYKTGDSCTAKEARLYVVNPGDPVDWDRNGLSRNHLAVRFRLDRVVYYWDSEGLYDTSLIGNRFGDSVGEAAGTLGDGLTVQECKAISASSVGWNCAFDREQVPLMQHLTNHYLKYGLM